MQGLQALDQFKNFVSKIGGLGRYEDTYIVHAAEGETVVPMEVLDKNPVLKKRLFKTMMEMGIEPGRYIVGNELNSKNPVTGQPEFFLKKIVGQIRKAIPGDLEQYLGPIVGMATGNPFLGALAGGIGSGAGGAIAGGLGGYRSPGIGSLGEFGRKFGGDSIFNIGTGGKVGPVAFKDLFKREGAGRFFFGDEKDRGLFGKFDFMGDDKTKEAKTLKETFLELEKEDPGNVNNMAFAKDQVERAGSAAKSVFGGMSVMDAAKLYGLGTVGIGVLIKLTEDKGDVGERRAPYQATGEIYNRFLNPKMSFATDMPIVNYATGGGVMDLQDGGESVGPGTGTSDSIPAMLSDGEFVMTAKAVRGAGGGDRREGARKMYEAMDRLEARA
jgi:hypothetical protein